jgi:hypothetical protein
LTPESYNLQKKGHDEGHSEAEMSEISDNDSCSSGNLRYKKKVTPADSESDSDFVDVRRKSRKRRGHQSDDSNSSAEERSRVRFDEELPKATYEWKFTHRGELIADSWAGASLSDAEHCSKYAAMTSSAKLQSMKAKFMKVLRYHVLDGGITVHEASLIEQRFDQNQNKAIQEIIGTVIPSDLVDSLIETMDGSVFGAAQYEQFQQKTDKWLKENVKLSSPTTNKTVKLTPEGYLQSIGQLPQFIKDIRWKSVDELRFGSSKTSDKGASDTKNTIGKWANNVQTSSSSSSSYVIQLW